MKRSEFSPNGSAVENLIRQTLKKCHSPVMIIRKSLLRKQYERFRIHLPKVTPYYAIKANPHPEIVKTFLRLGANFDVASANEMNLVLSLGAHPDRMIFANTIKSAEDLQAAYRRRVRLMTFDNEPELYKIAKHAPGSRVIVRIKVENIGSIVELSLKFGADAEHAVFLLRKAKGLGLRPEGVSFHVGSQCSNVENYVHALEVAAQIFREAKQEGLHLSILDIGGGFPIRHTDQDKQPVFEIMARKIRAEMSRLFDKKTKFIAEPGRFLVGPAGILVTQVIGRTFRNNKNYYYLNDGIYGDFSGIVFDHCKYELKTLRRGQRFLSTVAGPTCDSLDTISLSEELPELDVGSIVYVKNIGAYSSASAVQSFNGFAPAKIILVD
ncbi:MAG: type III PLP-dependent enzyme [Candidatus Omnitrophica bacterium]|nr:type III PLP-dependent enzyme [Candidatus Omnitrophota bacterium]